MKRLIPLMRGFPLFRCDKEQYKEKEKEEKLTKITNDCDNCHNQAYERARGWRPEEKMCSPPPLLFTPPQLAASVEELWRVRRGWHLLEDPTGRL
jgi:hypothetical protein